MRLITNEEAEEMTSLLALKEGLFIGPSSGTILHLALEEAKKLDKGVLVAIAPDRGEIYLSISLCIPELCVECVKRYSI
ncbi:MAG: hypothetical protein ACFFFH_03285 [Candidatus Thorarchaeota archaeon]